MQEKLVFVTIMLLLNTFKLNLDNGQKDFHDSLCSVRVTVEMAFGILKGHFGCPFKRFDIDLENVVKTKIYFSGTF